MTSDPESRLFDFAVSNRVATNEEEEIVTEVHAALGMTGVPLRLRRPPTPTPTPRWRNYMYVAMTFTLVIAVATAGFFAIRQQSVPPSPTEVPEVVLGLASPDSAIETAACEIGASIPVVKGASVSPVDGTALLLTPGGDLILDCGDNQEVIASGIESVTPQSWPGVVSTWDGEHLIYLNIFSGDSYLSEDLTIPNNLNHLRAITSRSTNRLVITPVTGSPADAAILDLATFIEEPLVDHNGQAIPLANIPTATSNYQGDCMVIAYSNHYAQQNTSYLGGFVIVPTEGNVQVIASEQPQTPTPRELAASPSCDQYASVGFQGEQRSGTTTINVYDTSGGEPIRQVIESTDLSTRITWLKSDTGFVYGVDDRLMIWEAPYDSTEPSQLADGIMVDNISLTRDLNVVTAIGMNYDGGPEIEPARTLIVDVSNREVTTIEGQYPMRGFRLQPQEHNVLIVQTDHTQIYDATTGEHLGDLEGEADFSYGFIMVPRDAFGSAETGIIGSEADDLWRVLDSNGEPVFEKINLPADADIHERPSPSTSKDGWIYLSTGWDSSVGWMKDLDDADAAWVEINFDPDADVNEVQFLNTEGIAETPIASPEVLPVIMLEPHEPVPGFGATERDMPILVSYVDSLPDSEEWINFNPNTSQMKIRFDFDRGYAELAVRNGIEIQSTFYPNIFLAYVPNGVQIVNISSLTMITIQTEVSAEELERINFPLRASQWMVIPDTSLVIDTSTMAVTAMNQYIPGPMGIYSAIASNDGSTLVAAIALENETTALARIHPDGDVETIHTENEYERFDINVLSPNGQYLATRPTHAGSETSSQGIEIIDLESGAVVASAEIPGRAGPTEPVWVEDGTAIVFASDDLIQKLTVESNLVETIHESQGMEFALRQTRDSNVILVQQESSSTSTAPENTENPLQVIMIDVRDGSVIVALDGRDQTMGISTEYAITRNAAMVEENPAISSTHEINVTVIDTATGEVVGTIERPARDTARTGAVKSAWGTVNGDIQFVSWGSQYTYKIVNNDSSATVEQVPPPPGAASENDLAVTIRSSGDSDWLAMHVEVTGEWWIADLTEPEPIWQQLPTSDQVIFASKGEPIEHNTATPAASPVAAVCDLTGDVPFIAGLDSSPLDGAVVLHTMNRELIVDCDGNQTMLLGDVMVASPTTTPHVLHAITGEGDYFINIVTNEQLFIPQQTDLTSTVLNVQPWGPWVVMRSSTDDNAASVYNLETMTETLIVTHARVPLSLEEVAESPMYSDNNRFVIAYPWVSEAGTRYLNGFFIVEADGRSNVIVVGHEAFPRELAVSPDGQLFATASFHGSRGEGTTTVTLFGPQDDMIIKQYELRTMDQPVELTWQHDGSGLLLHDIFNLYRIDAEYPGDGLEVLAEGQNLQSMVLTPDNDVVAISSSVHSQTPATITLIVHIPTGEVIEVDGQDLWTSPYITSTRTTLVLTKYFTAGSGGMQTLTVVNAVTGEVVGEMENETLRDGGFSSSSYGTGRGDIMVVAFAPDSMWKLVDENGNATLEQIPSPPIGDDEVEAITILVSDDGHISLRMFGEEFSAWLLEPDSNEWIQVDLPSIEESQGMLPMVAFIPGAD